MKTSNRNISKISTLTQHAQNAIGATSTLVPQWLSTGAALTLAKTGTRVAKKLVLRNPAAAVAIGVVGVGVLAYRMYRRRAVVVSDATEQVIPSNTAERSPLELKAVRKGTRRSRVNRESALTDA